MWIQVRSMDGRKCVRLDDLSKLTKIEALRERLVDHFDAEAERQRLFYRGKQLVDGQSLFDYDVGLNDIIQIYISPPQTKTETTPTDQPTNGADSPNDDAMETDSGVCGSGSDPEENCIDDDTTLYKVGEKIDAKDLRMGAWFEGVVVKITRTNRTSSSSEDASDDIQYHVKYDDYEDDYPVILSANNIRPRARSRMQWDQLSVGQIVMVNYNPDHPTQRGYWYDAEITRKVCDTKKLYVKLCLGVESDVQQECRIKFIDEIFSIERKESPNELTGEGEARMKKPDCDYCKDNPSRKCHHCACSVCGGKNDPEKQLLCDECDNAFHLSCLDPPLDEIPESDEWYCSECKTDTSEVIGAGEKMRLTKKKANMISKKGNTTRDWGKGMACVGRTKVCTIVPSNHFGPIPGIPVGTLWKFRVQVSESGVHRPHIAGIHGRESEGSYSIVLSGGYDDDKDDGDEFVYSGSGGRDLSGNKRTAKQSMDQKLTAMNRALAKNCNAPINDKTGAEAKDWKKGKPVRVVRNHKGRKTSQYCPKEGNRYDGIYKIVKYWPQRNDENFLVWKYLLRRDDPSPAPWTSEGKKNAKKLGLTLQYPEGYLESRASGSGSQEQSSEDERSTPSKRGRKRKSDGKGSSSPAEKLKQPRYDLNQTQKKLIKRDTANSKLWKEIVDSTGSAGLLEKIQDSFTCIVCQELVYKPVTTPCGHNICKTCLQRSFKAQVFTCPSCRHQLGGQYELETNDDLQSVLLEIFPGYDGGR
ncbi:PREDICTED: E3 ubiquitin-protein ligase UHRF1 [Amphimedon queenslandica]|uniref:RING-type E3 ubiquitin transferase n=1 Tax=Amphimedon queenslandica TaxID=400682 RepID=A0A1X7VG83_AMPQE|nr:PREDICTED: E3 ubiquitin-protein ligase UHRF1 [Amphimedon queenslandica]|eukprot:XP_019849105.1 PREDICTED: E3 ubiquitin-protein ligase UHRF1 [Amphimedon queenslandica]